MKKLVYVIVFLMVGQLTYSQTIDDERLNRDLEVAKNILGTLMKNESDVFMDGRGINADYVDGYGVIFTIPRHYVYFHVPPPKINPPKIRIEGIGNDNKSYVIVGEDEESGDTWDTSGSDKEAQEKALREQERAIKKQEEAIKAQEEAIADMEAEIAEAQKNAQYAVQQWQEEAGRSNANIKKAVITFLADYADLIGQLKPDDRIMVNQESPYDEFAMVGWIDENDPDVDVEVDSEGDNPSIGFSMEVTKKDISAYKGGKISMNEFKNRIEIKEKKPAKKVADLEMFASIFKQYYSPKLSSTFFTERTPSYEVLDNFGAIFKINTYSSYVEGQLYYMPILGKEKVDSEERKQTVESLYPKFKSDIKSFLIDYGRTIRSLDENETLMLKISMTKCNDCSIPKSIDVSVKMSVLRQFDQQKLSREKALQAIEIKENYG